MRKIGRIVTKSKAVETLDLVDVTDNATMIDNSVPTLIIGKQFAEKIYGKEKIHVIDKRIKDNIYWTFGKLERKNDYERDILSFNNLIVKNLFNNIKYTYFNVYTTTYNDCKGLIQLMRSNNKKIVYYINNHLYIYSDNEVIGVSLIDLEYIGIKREKISKRLKTYKNVKIITNDYFISKNMRKYTNGSNIIVPYVYFLLEN